MLSNGTICKMKISHIFHPPFFISFKNAKKRQNAAFLQKAEMLHVFAGHGQFFGKRNDFEVGLAFV